MNSDLIKVCEPAALRLLAQRDHSRYELAQKLRQRCDCDTESLDQLLDRLQELGYLNDLRFAQSFIRYSAMKGRGSQRVLYDLQERGVDTDLITQALAEAEIDWITLACEQRNKKFGSSLPKNYQERARQSRFLAGRGFSLETIKAVFQNFPAE